MPKEPMKLEKVQQWVAWAIIFAIGSFPMGALIVASNVINREGRAGAAIAAAAVPAARSAS